jgi:hypothetical protein
VIDPDDGAVEFGATGSLYNNNLVMYDRRTDSYWTQLDGLAIFGELTGWRLKMVSINTVTWAEWKAQHPDSQVLSQDTGYSRAYGVDPYGGYYESDFILFPVDGEDDRIHAKTLIFGVEVNGMFKAYRRTDIEASGVIEDIIGGVIIKVELQDDGGIGVTNVDTGEPVVAERSFWFAWYAFHPETLLYPD